MSSGCLALTSVTTFGLNLDDENSLVVTGTPNSMDSLMELKHVSEDPTLNARLKRKFSNKNQATVNSLGEIDFSKSVMVAINDNTRFAPNGATSSMSLSDDQQSSKQKALGASIQLGESMGLFNHTDGTRDKSLDIGTSLSYRLRHDVTLGADLSGSIDQNNYENNDMSRGAISISKGGFEYYGSQSLKKVVSLLPSLSLSIPVSKYQRAQSFQSGLTTALSISLGEGLVPSNRLSIQLGVSATRNFFGFEQAISGASNTQYSSIQSLTFGYEFPANFSALLSLYHFNSWTFQGTAGEAYSHIEELSYKISKSFTTSLGHQFGSPAASIYRADGQTLNLNLVNETDSYVYANITYTY